jgi:hypothetical protein
MRDRFALLTLLAFMVGCNDDPAPTGNEPPPSTSTAPAASTKGYLRAAQLSEDARSVDFVANDAVLATGIDYGHVGPHAQLDAGEYRVQFFPEGKRGVPLVETRLTLGPNQAITVAIVGDSSEIMTINDDRSTRSDRGGLRLANTVPDFPAPFDLAIQNGPGLLSGVGYLQVSGKAELIPGVYGFELRRHETVEEIATIEGQAISAGGNYTVYALGTHRRDNIELLVTRDSF